MIIFLLAISCSEKTEDTGSTTVDDTSTIPDEIDPCEGIEGNSNIGMNGTIEFSDGTTPQGSVRVQMCNADICFVAKWRNESDFCFPIGTFPANMPYAFDLVPTLDGGETYAQPLSILNPSESFSLDQPVVIPNFSNTWSSTDGTSEFVADNGLTIFINSEYNEETLSAIAIDIENGGLPLGSFNAEEILGGWYLGPFDTHVSGMDIEVQSDSITEGTTYNVYNGDYEGKQWLPTAEVTAMEDGTLTVPSGLSILSTLLITQ